MRGVMQVRMRRVRGVGGTERGWGGVGCVCVLGGGGNADPAAVWQPDPADAVGGHLVRVVVHLLLLPPHPLRRRRQARLAAGAPPGRGDAGWVLSGRREHVSWRAELQKM